jgi:hypothetical protein
MAADLTIFPRLAQDHFVRLFRQFTINGTQWRSAAALSDRLPDLP